MYLHFTLQSKLYTVVALLQKQIHYDSDLGHIKSYFRAETISSVSASRLLFFIFLRTTRDQSLKGIRSLLGLDID